MTTSSDASRYAKQIRFGPFGETGQEAVGKATVLIVGCGALGSASANTLTRAGVGHLRIVDRDFLEMSNLQRQALYTEADVADGLPKAIAAARHLSAINSDITVEPFITDVNASNIRRLVEGADLIVDGTDNFETRFLLNDVSVKFSIPWIYGGVLGGEGQCLVRLPESETCFRCLFPEGPPEAGSFGTCDSAGVLAPIVEVISAIQCCEALKILSKNRDAVSRSLVLFDLWGNRFRQFDVSALRPAGGCPVCDRRQFEWLGRVRGSSAAILCGRNAVQIRANPPDGFDFASIASRLQQTHDCRVNDFFLKLSDHHSGEPFELTLFTDGRAIIVGTEDIAIAKSIYSRWVGL